MQIKNKILLNKLLIRLFIIATPYLDEKKNIYNNRKDLRDFRTITATGKRDYKFTRIKFLRLFILKQSYRSYSNLPLIKEYSSASVFTLKLINISKHTKLDQNT